jgi:translation initiation factor 6
MGSPNIGIYSLATDNFAIIPAGIPKTKIDRIENILKVKTVSMDLSESKLIGVLAAANSNGIVLPHYSTDDEIQFLKRTFDVNVARVMSKKTALGNLILSNDNGAIIDPGMTKLERKTVSDILGVEVVPGRIVSLPYVGSLAIATNKGALLHPNAKEDEKKLVKEVLKVPVDVGTVNYGVPYLSSGIIVNSYGAIVGSVTTGPEILIIGQALDVAT